MPNVSNDSLFSSCLTPDFVCPEDELVEEEKAEPRGW